MADKEGFHIQVSLNSDAIVIFGDLVFFPIAVKCEPTNGILYDWYDANLLSTCVLLIVLGSPSLTNMCELSRSNRSFEKLRELSMKMKKSNWIIVPFFSFCLSFFLSSFSSTGDRLDFRTCERHNMAVIVAIGMNGRFCHDFVGNIPSTSSTHSESAPSRGNAKTIAAPTVKQFRNRYNRWNLTRLN